MTLQSTSFIARIRRTLQEHGPESALSSANEIAPQASVSLLEQLASVFIQADAIHEATILLGRALELDPGNATRNYNVATGLRMLGDLEMSRQKAEAALKADPDFVEAFHLLIDLGPVPNFSAHVIRMEALCKSETLHPLRQRRLHAAMGQAYHNLGEFAQAFKHFRAGGRLARRFAPYSVEHDLASLDALVKNHRTERLRPSKTAAQSCRPLFVFGLPRSGTTLIEQIILRSGGVASAGERTELATAVIERSKRDLSPSPINRLALIQRCTDIDLPQLGRDYLGLMTNYASYQPCLIDKTPLNYLYAGLIHSALPKAQMLMLRRRPRDSLVAIFRGFFSGLYPFADDPVDLARYICAFDRLADHWYKTLPANRYREISYEKFVTAPEAEGQALFLFLGRPWNSRVLAPNRANTASTSASATQIRKEISTSSIDVWKSYEPYLARALDMLPD